MSNVTAVPEMMAAAATDVAAIGSTVNAAHMAAAAPTVAVIPAAADEVSASIAQVFSRLAQNYHALVGQAAAFSQQFVQHLNAGAGSYAGAEAVSAASLIPDVGSLIPNLESSVSGIVALPGQLLNGLISSITNLANTLLLIVNALILPFYVAYELLVFSYLTLGILISLEESVLKAFGIAVVLPSV